MLGGGEPVITTDITISVDHIDKMVADSLSAVDRGFESLKIKVGKDIGVDIERVRAIYAAVEGRALLRLDANQGWTAKQAVYAMQARSEEHTSELQSLMRISYAVFCLKKKNTKNTHTYNM